jgi:hypothetical protein
MRTHQISRTGRAIRQSLLGLALSTSCVVSASTQTPTVASMSDWRSFPAVASDLAQRWHLVTWTGVAPVVTGAGPAVQVTTITPASLLRTEWRLSGTYAAGATFTSAVDAAPTDVGVSVGSGALTCIVAPDGTARFDAHGSTLSVADIDSARRPATAILLRVSDTAVTCLVNGHPAVTLAPMALTGAPGIYVGASSSVLVAGFTTETAPTVAGGR